MHAIMESANKGLTGTQEFTWKGIYYQTVEHCRFIPSGKGHRIEGEIIGMAADKQCFITYKIELTSGFEVNSVSVFRGWEREQLYSLSRLEGKWYDDKGYYLPGFDNCTDIDIAITPSTNTLPIRRLSLTVGVPVTIEALYLDPLKGLLEVSRQVYTKLEENLFLYQNEDSRFTALLSVDGLGVVNDYNGVWNRLYPHDGTLRKTRLPAKPDEFVSALLSGKGGGGAPMPLGMYNRLIGAWQLTILLDEGGGNQWAIEGEWYFESILEGMAIQDVFIAPSRYGPEYLSAVFKRIGTGFRMRDEAPHRWQIFWLEPSNNITSRWVGYEQDDEVIEENREGSRWIRWHFRRLERDSFECSLCISADEGERWQAEAKIYARRK